YTWEVDVRAAGTTVAYDAYAIFTYSLVSTQPCSIVTVTPSLGSPQPAGTAVTFTASPSGCSSAEYRFYNVVPGSSWQLLRDWSTTPTFSYTGTVPGTYYWEVDVRAAGTSVSYDAYRVFTYSLSGNSACTGITVTPSLPSPQGVGTSVTYTAAATGCGS